MKTFRFQLLALIVLLGSVTYGQKKLKKADRHIVSNIQVHVHYLNADNLKGRKAGTDGEKLADEYIIKQFTRHGLKPLAQTKSWYQPFEIYDGNDVLPSSQLSINGTQMKLYEDYFPLAFSANKNAEAAVSISLAENGVPWFKDVRELIDTDDTVRVDTFDIIRKKAAQAASKGATALIIYNKSGNNDLQFNKYDRSEKASIPVLYINKEAFKKYCSDESAILDVKLNIGLKESKRTGNNVMGFADNGADSTVITSANLGEVTQVAALIEIARLLKKSKPSNRNYLFIAFSGEQKGESGNNYFNDHPAIDPQKVKFAMDLDTVTVKNEQLKGLYLVKNTVEILKNK